MYKSGVKAIVTPANRSRQKTEEERKEHLRQIREKMVAGAHRYAFSDRSDPFTFDRCMTHIENGICTLETGNNGQKGYYDADMFKAKRSYVVDGVEIDYYVDDTRNVVRP